MLHINPYQHRQPFGGHHFKDHGVMFKADTFPQLLQKVKDFRINNGLPLRAPDQEILQFYAKHWPWTVISDETPSKSDGSNFAAWRTWVSKTWNTPPIKLQTSKEAALRWDVCRKCPFNVKFDWTETPESVQIQRRSFVMRRGLPVPVELGFCTLHKADLAVFCFIDDTTKYSDKEPGKEHKDCWVKPAKS